MYINGLGKTQWPTGVEKTITEQNSFVDNNGFLQILAAQLKYQDPMGQEGSGSGDQIMQMSQFAMIEQLTRMTETMDRLYALSATGEAINMVGKEVTLKTQDAQVQGVVEKVEISEEGTHYWIGGKRYTHPLVMEVAAGAQAEPSSLLDPYLAPRPSLALEEGPVRPEEMTDED